jgi:hypothetical protein
MKLTKSSIASAAMLTLLFVLCASAVHADMIPGAQAKALCAKGDMGPTTSYGETPQETADKKVVFEWNCMVFVDRKVDEAFAKYVSKDWCDYGHLINHMKKTCGTREETMAMFRRMTSAPLGDKDMVAFPPQATVNGPMVTVYGEGVDIFEVRNGKLVAHYDASPTKAVSFKDHHAMGTGEDAPSPQASP